MVANPRAISRAKARMGRPIQMTVVPIPSAVKVTTMMKANNMTGQPSRRYAMVPASGGRKVDVVFMVSLFTPAGRVPIPLARDLGWGWPDSFRATP